MQLLCVAGIALMAYSVADMLRPLFETSEPSRRPSESLKAQVLERDGRACAYCGVLTTYKTRHYDHKTPVAAGGKTSLSNLCVACKDCNLSKGNLSAWEFRQMMMFG